MILIILIQLYCINYNNITHNEKLDEFNNCINKS